MELQSPDAPTRTSDEGLTLIKRFEGCSLKAYLCTAGIPTIGYGHTGPELTHKDVTDGFYITPARADELLRKDLLTAEVAVARYTTVPLNQNQFDALVSLVFNIGTGAFQKSTLLKRLNAAAYNDAADQFLVWRRAGGKVSLGLERRRQQERELFLKGGV